MERINKLNYWSDEQHKKWKSHYFEGGWEQDLFLAFTKEWSIQNLPKNSTLDELWCKLVDTLTGKVYEMPIYAAYEHEEINDWYLNYEDFTNVDVKYQRLNSYFYEQHHCPCHRHTDAVKAGLQENDDNFECEGDRFQIQSITPKDSDLILYSETMSYEELEEALNGHQNKN